MSVNVAPLLEFFMGNCPAYGAACLDKLTLPTYLIELHWHMASPPKKAGRVLNRADLELAQHHYDVVVIGAGMLGLALSFYLQSFQPDASLLVTEQDGVPSELGASFVAPAIFDSSSLPEQAQAKADWCRTVLLNLAEETGITRPHDTPFRTSGVLRFAANAGDTTHNSEVKQWDAAQHTAIEALVNLNQFSPPTFDPGGGYGSAEAVQLHYGYGAIKRGATLMLNTRVVPLNATELKLERLEYDRHMRRTIVKKEAITADRIIVAAGATAVPLVEAGIGTLLPYERTYQQYPRVERDPRLPLVDKRVNLPVIRAAGFALRPQGEGLLIVPPPLAGDPAGYTPGGGQLMGVRVGLRREIINQFITHTDALPVLMWDSLNLGKTVDKVRGAWQAVTPDGLPQGHVMLDSNGNETAWSILVGGEHGFTLGLATAYELAAELSNLSQRPWTKT